MGTAGGGAWFLKTKTQKQDAAAVATLTRTPTLRNVAVGGNVAIVATEVLDQDGMSFTTSFDYHPNTEEENWSDYHRPWKITSSGHLTKAIERAFDYDFGTLYLLDRIKTETVTVGTESFTVDREFTDATGFLEAKTTYGVEATFGPDAHGNHGSMTDANGKLTTYSYEWGALKNTVTPEFTITRVMNSDGTVKSEVRRGFTTSFDYDAIGRVTKVTPPVGDAINTAYDDPGGSPGTGSFIKVTRGAPGSTQTVTTTLLDGYGRPRGTENSAVVKTQMAYDVHGRKSFQSYPFLGAAVRGDTFQYDALDRVKSVTHSGGAVVEYAYAHNATENANSVTITDENGQVTVQYWKAFGDPADARLVKLTDANEKHWLYGYNALGNLTLVDSPEGPDRIWSYNSKNWLFEETHPESGLTQYLYTDTNGVEDKVGNVKRKIDANGVTLQYSYDGNNRLLSITRPGMGSGDNVEFDYDDSDNRTLVKTSLVTTTLGYTGANQLESRTDGIAGKSFTTLFKYLDGRDNLNEIHYPSGRKVFYEHDTVGRVTKVRDLAASGVATTYADTITYHPSGAVKSYNVGNGTKEDVEFDLDRYWPTRIRTFLPTTPPAPPPAILDLTYGYDEVGNVTGLNDAVQGHNSTFGYDALDRLETITGWGAASFAYDALGNRTGTAGFTYNYNESPHANTNRLTSITRSGDPTTFFNYGLNGNTIAEGS
jgi:YD repeat-containing protein